MSIDSVRSDGVCSEGGVDVLVDEAGAGDAVGEVEVGAGAKKIDRVAGPVWSVDRFIVIEMAGLWYLSRGR